ncbi:ion channel [Massilia cavernae]|uniref:Two pore domain potassium channel family protein n=1 Tax=Massilia cavernae TaxID=2320864 RepID=A0A418Y4I1_9BURK|nr:ion channel [Massilia cavernae]RJG20724.1 two pore domain potassium channel family protein [Massilia cavernae]
MASISLFHHTKRHPSAILLLVQLAGMILYPYFEDTEMARVGLNAFGLIVLLATVGMVRRTPGHVWISATIAVPVIILLILQMGYGMKHLLPWSSALEAMFYFYAAGSLVMYMMEDRRATADELFAAAAAFTLLAWAFTHLYILVQAVYPGSFGAAVNPNELRTWTELNYLSFALLSSTGIGDVIPLSSHARALASVEMLIGLMYLAAVVARLIGFTITSHKETRD